MGGQHQETRPSLTPDKGREKFPDTKRRYLYRNQNKQFMDYNQVIILEGKNQHG